MPATPFKLALLSISSSISVAVIMKGETGQDALAWPQKVQGRVKGYEVTISHLAGAGLSARQQQQMPVAALLRGMARRGIPDAPMRCTGMREKVHTASATCLELSSLIISSKSLWHGYEGKP